MSDGHKSSSSEKESRLITLSPEEFGQVVRRVHDFLVHRAERARTRKGSHPSERAAARHVEASKDAFVFVHMMELIEHLSNEIVGLRQALAVVGEVRASGSGPPALFSSKKTDLPN